jgi:hypothetical protein
MKRYSDLEKNQILQAWAESGLNRAAFCRERGLCYASVGAWAKARSRGSTGPVDFVEVSMRAALTGDGIEVWLPGSICVRFGADTSAEALAQFCRRVSSC